MSRIVRNGEASDVKEYQPAGGGSVRLGGRSFHVGKVDGTFSTVELEKVREQARAEGRKQGIQEAEKRLAEPLQAALQNLESMLDDVSRFRKELFKDAEKEAVELVRFISKKILRKELSLHEELLNQIVEKGLEIVEKEKSIHIVFNPADLKTFQASKEDFMQKFSAGTDLKFTVDPQIPSGRALLKTEPVEVDVNVESMVDQLLSQVAQEKISDREVNDEEQPK